MISRAVSTQDLIIFNAAVVLHVFLLIRVGVGRQRG